MSNDEKPPAPAADVNNKDAEEKETSKQIIDEPAKKDADNDAADNGKMVQQVDAETKDATLTAPAAKPAKPTIHKVDFEKDVVYLYQFSRTANIPSPSPFCLKVETWLRMAGIKYEVPPFSFSYQSTLFKSRDVCHAFLLETFFCVHSTLRVLGRNIFLTHGSHAFPFKH